MSTCSCEKQDRYANCCYRKRAEKEVKRLREALEFYADPETYCMYEDLSTEDWKHNWIAERQPGRVCRVGERARKALNKESE